MLGQPDELREWRRGLATRAAQLRDEAVERRLRVPLELAQIELLQLPAAGAPDVEEVELGGQGDADHRRPSGFVPPLHQPVPLGDGCDAELVFGGLVLASGRAVLLFEIFVAGSHAHEGHCSAR